MQSQSRLGSPQVPLAVISETHGSRKGKFLAVPFEKNGNMVRPEDYTGPVCKLHG